MRPLPGAERKILFSGPPGAGKTTAISMLSDIPVVGTDARATDTTAELKERTTVAMDYGLIRLPTGDRVHLYGTPGQERFGFMRGILGKGAIGLVILLRSTSEEPLDDLARFAEAHAEFMADNETVIGVTGLDLQRDPGIAAFREHARSLGIDAPVAEVDARDERDVRQIVTILLTLMDPCVRR